MLQTLGGGDNNTDFQLRLSCECEGFVNFDHREEQSTVNGTASTHMVTLKCGKLRLWEALCGPSPGRKMNKSSLEHLTMSESRGPTEDHRRHYERRSLAKIHQPEHHKDNTVDQNSPRIVKFMNYDYLYILEANRLFSGDSNRLNKTIGFSHTSSRQGTESPYGVSIDSKEK